MTNLQRFLATGAMTLLVATLPALSQDTPATKKGSMNADMRFAKEAAAGGMAEVKLGQLAADKGTRDDVKSFGKKMVDDHSKAGDQLKSVAEKDKITLPSNLMPKDQALYDRLSKLSGSAFDTAYINAMVRDHRQDVASFRKEASSGGNADLKDFAAQTLPVIQGHLQMIEGMQKGGGHMPQK